MVKRKKQRMSETKSSVDTVSLKTYMRQLWVRGVTLFHTHRKWIRRGWLAFAIFLAIVALFFTIFRALTPWAKQYKGDVERHLSLLVGQPVAITSMETSWYWFEPVLKLNQITVTDHQQRVLTLDKLLVGINLFSSLWHWHIQPGILYIDNVHLNLQQHESSWEIEGFRLDKSAINLSQDTYLPILGWLLDQQKIIVKNVSILLHLKDGTLIPLSDMNLTAFNRSGHYRLKGNARLAQTVPTTLSILADIKLHTTQPNAPTGKVYIVAKKVLLAQWQTLLPQSVQILAGGKGDAEVWLDVRKGQITNLQSKLNLHHIAWQQHHQPQTQLIQSLTANLAWQPLADGWQLSGDRIKLRAGSMIWPVNSFIVRYGKDQQLYRFFIQHILLQPLLSMNIPWPYSLNSILALRPVGTLYDTQWGINEGKVSYFLTKFTDLGWQEKDVIPGVQHLSGVASWQPTEGRLELDSENTIVTPQGLPPIQLTQVNTALEWKALSNDFRVSMDRLVLSHPNFVLSARGSLDNPLSPPSRYVQLSAEFSAKQATQWLAYLPSRYLKPKLNTWLKKDVTQIKQLTGHLILNGKLMDFPFDKEPGEFVVDTHLSGVDLSFNRAWPFNREIEADLRFNKRTLDADIYHVVLNDIPADQVNLHMDDIGLNHDTLLVHGKVTAPAHQALNYIFASPLKSYLAKLKQLSMQRLIGLDLRLEVPFNSEKNNILARGTVTFTNNKTIYHHELNDIIFNDLSGILQFDEHGVTNSQLKAVLLDEPVDIHIQTEGQPHPATKIMITGDTTIASLQQHFNLPLLAFMKGQLMVSSLLTLTENQAEADTLSINTNLAGVSINLPPPFAKSVEVRAPLSMVATFGSEPALRLKVNYDNRLESDIWFNRTTHGLILQKGNINLNSGPVAVPIEKGLSIKASLPELNVPQWQTTLKNFSNHPDPGALKILRTVDMKVGKLMIFDKTYPEVAFQAHQLSADAWQFKLNQHDIAGDLVYKLPTHSLKGHFNHIYWAKLALSDEAKALEKTEFKPNDIPNLNLTVDVLKLGQVNIGKIDLQSTSTRDNLHLEACHIMSPGYQVLLKGDWHQDEANKNHTTFDADVNVTQLADSLKNWGITPVVEARQGSIQIKGSWPGAIQQFSWAKMQGGMFVKLQNGRITNLSKETEEKLGLGKLLSILSLQTIPRRLKLDFSDLSNNGYSYDVFSGNFAVSKGVMTTNDSYIDGPVAYASMKGDLDIAKRLYDVELHISPHITASLPVVATIAGGPIAGIAAWAASKIINQSMQTVTGYTYKISGPWLKPVVQQVSIFKKQTDAVFAKDEE